MAGASNWITPAKVLDAVKWIKDGKMHRIGRMYESGMPKFGERAFTMRIPGSPTGGPFGTNRLVYHDEYLCTEIGQTGTQFDGLGHIGIQMGKDGDKNEMRYYNGLTEQEIGGAYGIAKIGIENVKPFFTRGHLFDVEAHKGKMMEAGEEITLADLRACMQKQGMNEADIKEGDALFFNTGWGKLWLKNNDKFNSGEPGIGLEVAKWVVETGCLPDLARTSGRPKSCPIPTRIWPSSSMAELISKQGIFNHENLDFTTLDRRPEVPIRLHLLAGADQRRDRLQRRPDRGDLIARS